MAIDNILNAITQETDRRIAEAKTSHASKISAMRDASERRLLEKKSELDNQRREKEQWLRSKGETHVSQKRRNAILQKKQELLERCYGDVQKALTKQSPAVLEKFLSHCLKSIHEKGEIRPAKAHQQLLEKLIDKSRFTIGKPVDAIGGFIFTSDKHEKDCTFESLVTQTLRPRTEVDVARALFA